MGAATAEVTIAQATVAQATVAQATVARFSPLPGGPLSAGPLPGGALPVTPLPVRSDDQDGAARRDGLASLLAEGNVRSGREVGPDNGALPDADLLPVLPALRDLLPHGALARGSVVSAGTWSLLCLALAAGPVAAGAWCAAAGIPEGTACATQPELARQMIERAMTAATRLGAEVAAHENR